MEKNQADRYLWQKECLEAWKENSCRGIVQAVTGAGKSHLAWKAMGWLQTQRPGGVRVKIIVPTRALMLQWRNFLKAMLAGAPEGLIGCYGSRNNGRRDKQYMIYIINSARYRLARCILQELASGEDVLLIADECHHYASGENRKIFEFVPHLQEVRGSYYALGLSAAPEVKDYDSTLAPSLGRGIYRYSYGQALAGKTVCEFAVFQIAVSFREDELKGYEELTESMRKVRTGLLNRHPHLRHIGGEFWGLLQQLAANGREDYDGFARKYLYLSYQRKRTVCLAENRLDCAVRLLEEFSDKRIFIFGESINQAEALYRRIKGVYAGRVGRYHSQMGKQANENTLQRFRDGELRILIACKALDEGLDVPEASVGIILSGTSMERQRLQRLGRIVRHSGGKHIAALYYLFVRGTREEKGFFPQYGECFRTADLEYDAAAGFFSFPDYEKRQRRLLAGWRMRTRGALSAEELREAKACMESGRLRPDWMLGEERCLELAAGETQLRRKNYWLCMAKLAAG